MEANLATPESTLTAANIRLEIPNFEKKIKFMFSENFFEQKNTINDISQKLTGLAFIVAEKTCKTRRALKKPQSRDRNLKILYLSS